ncbi:hypothetical protein BG262_03455 [Floricoccus penangensis]|uniref:HTH gntR-type domain-containing protein n=2 Tax=Floricoccus penangensis TaxID=1859475 RepID=A0A9Q5JH43_9LACT|nr:hypothetical protein BG262_03455 [Floricoccus penangensis]
MMSKLPIYEQVAEKIKLDIVKGKLNPGDQLLSVRAMAVEEGVNPNTIAKSYQLLEREGVIVAMPNKGNFVSEDVNKLNQVQKQDMLDELTKMVKDIMKLGVSKDELVEVIRGVANDA